MRLLRWGLRRIFIGLSVCLALFPTFASSRRVGQWLVCLVGKGGGFSLGNYMRRHSAADGETNLSGVSVFEAELQDVIPICRATIAGTRIVGRLTAG